MDKFSRLARHLAELEQSYFERLRDTFAWTEGLRSCITGAVQFAAIDTLHRQSNATLPVVCAVGVNYTQGGIESTDGIIRFHTPAQKPSVELNTSSRKAVALAISAYNRNAGAWVNPIPSIRPSSPVNAYASAGATRDSGLTSEIAADLNDGFILVMTNVCPFISRFEWKKQIRKTAVECLAIVNEWPRDQYLEDLYKRIGASVDLWIGHSAIHGTDWVWPKFVDFTKRNNVKNWLLTPNISPRAHLYLDRHFRVKTNPRFPLFGPER
jgi:hypothetical protein